MIVDTIKILGRSVGDSNVGIPSCGFEIDLGVTELTEDDRLFLIKGMIRDMWELHDNGDLKFNFSDEMKEYYCDFTRTMDWKVSEEILKSK